MGCSRENDKKICCLGLTSLLPLPVDQLPGEALERVFKVTLDLLVAYKDQVAGSSLYYPFHFTPSMFFESDFDNLLPIFLKL